MLRVIFGRPATQVQRNVQDKSPVMIQVLAGFIQSVLVIKTRRSSGGSSTPGQTVDSSVKIVTSQRLHHQQVVMRIMRLARQSASERLVHPLVQGCAHLYALYHAFSVRCQLIGQSHLTMNDALRLQVSSDLCCICIRQLATQVSSISCVFRACCSCH